MTWSPQVKHRHCPGQVEGLVPSARGGASMTVVSDKVLAFGGANRSPTAFDDLWMLELGGLPAMTCVMCAVGLVAALRYMVTLRTF